MTVNDLVINTAVNTKVGGIIGWGMVVEGITLSILQMLLLII
ncbi:hypothetical protein cje33_04335 [Campylobacter jejuni subsp. jejuni 87330]|nr:hypothetical protein cje145_05414 [Campylobacter jejuni subsp. jejuni 2008-1025]EIB56371.1 hypothetical protein cje161_05420 [Campylobacter jejuni subsp. jejuni 2008-831]EIB71157.1 hypothetical protein cje33_04335 [Campylobacter jejuni subsp. jejuni 87330]